MLPPIDQVAEEVHNDWIKTKKAAGITSRLAENGEELMVPFPQLSEAQKNLDRNTVKAVYKAIEAQQQLALDILITTRYTAKANPQRGYHDYETVIEGNVGRLDEFFQRELLRHKQGSMWCSSKFEKTGVVTGKYTIHHGYDSGD